MRDQVHWRRPKEGRHERVGGFLVDLPWCADLADPAAVNNGDPVAHAHGLNLVVGHIDGGGTDFLLELLEFVTSRRPALGIEIGERLIEQEDIRLANQRPGQSHPLPLPPDNCRGFRSRSWSIPRMLDAHSICRFCSALSTFAALSGNAMLFRTFMCGYRA